MRFITAFIKWWNGEADVFKAPSTASNGVPRDRFAKVREHFDADGNYIFKDAGLARAAKTAKAVGATMTAGTWVAASLATATNNYGLVVATDGNNVVEVDVYGLINYSTNGGQSYSSHDLGLVLSNIGAAVNGATMVVCAVPSSPGTTNTAYVSTDSGGSWSAVTLPTSDNWHIPAVSGSTIVISNAGSNIIYSTDNGASWSSSTLPMGTCYSLAATPTTILAFPGGGTATLGISTNGGASWTSATLPVSGAWYGAISGSLAVAAIPSTTTSAYSTNGGVSWTEVTLPVSYTWSSVGLAGSFAVLSATNSAGYLYSTNGGASWTTTIQNFPVSADYYVAAQGSLAVAVEMATGTTNAAYMTLASAPSAPTLAAPANSSTINAANSNTFSATYNSTDGQNQNAFAMRFAANGGAYTYWDVATQTFSSSIVWNPSNVAPGNSFSVVLPANALTNGDSYTWSFASQEAGANLQGPFAGDFAFTAQAPLPSAPTLTAPANASTVDVAPGLTFSATYNPTDSGTQTSYAFRVKTSTGSYNYWNASTSALQSTIVWNAVSTAPGASWSLTLPPGVLTDGNIYNWSFASGEAGTGQQGPFATDFTLTSQAAPTVSVSAPSGTTTDAYPVVSWTAAMPSGAVQIGYQVIIESGAFGLTPGAGTSVWNSGAVSSTATSVGEPVGLQSGVTYRVFVQVTETNNVASAWAYSTFTASFVPPAAPTFTALAGTDPVTGAPMAILTIQANDNELTAAQASFETDTTGWAPGANTLLAASIAWAQDGAYSLAMTADAAGNVSASTPTGTSGVACAPGQTVRAMASFHSPVTARAATVAVTFYDLTGAVISTDTSASVNSTLTGNGAQAFLTTTAPVNAATMSVTLTGTALAAPNATLSTALVSGTAYTSLTVTALTTAIAASAPVVIATAGSYQVFTASAAVAIGATSIAVTSLAANANYPVGSTVDGEALYVDEVFVGPGSASTWSPGGFVGSSTVNFTFSDDGINWFAVRNGTGVAIPADQQVSVIDYEGALGFTRQYQAQVVAP